MAKIILDPGEVFEHYHTGTSTTTLLDGDAELTIGDRKVALVRGVVTSVPAGTPHAIHNIGSTVVLIDCGVHAPPPQGV